MSDDPYQLKSRVTMVYALPATIRSARIMQIILAISFFIVSP